MTRPGRLLLIASVIAAAACGGGPRAIATPPHGCALPHSSGFPAGPPWRAQPALSAGRGGLILYGGVDAKGPVYDTWVYDNHGWAPGAASSPQLDQPRMAYDPVRGATVLVGLGRGEAAIELWTWSDFGWQKAAPASGPPPYLGDTSFAWDSATHHLVLYADVPAGQAASHQMWSWDGSSWSRLRLPAGTPYYAQPQSMVEGPKGGLIGLGGAATFQWTGSAWSKLNVSGTPANVVAAAGAVNGKLVTLGSLSRRPPDTGAGTTTTFIFDGTAWSASPAPPEFASRIGIALSAFPTDCGAALWGGSEGRGFINKPSPPAIFTDTWLWDGRAWAKIAG